MRRLALVVLALCWTAASVSACDVPAGFSAELSKSLDLTNAFRRANDRQALTRSAELTRAAQNHACYMAATGAFSHTGAGGSTVGDRARDAGFQWLYISENIAFGQDFAEGAVGGWQRSAPHRKNMLSKNVRDIGMGLAAGATGQLYWVMVLGQSY